MSGGGIYPNPPSYENTDDYISNITGSAPRKQRESSGISGGDFDRQKLYGTDTTGTSTKKFEEQDNSCGTCCIKFFLFILNAVFLGAGGFVVAMGIVVMTKQQFHIIGKTLPIIVIAVGCGLILFAIYGCVSAKVNNRALLFVYMVFLVLLLVTFLAIGVVLILMTAKPSMLRTPATAGWKTAVNSTGPFGACTLQKEWGCSGWDTSPNCTMETPHNSETLCPACESAEFYPTTHGNCWNELKTFVKKNILFLVIGDLSAFATLLFAIIFTCCLCKRKVGVLTSERLLYKRINEYRL